MKNSVLININTSYKKREKFSLLIFNFLNKEKISYDDIYIII